MNFYLQHAVLGYHGLCLLDYFNSDRSVLSIGDSASTSFVLFFLIFIVGFSMKMSGEYCKNLRASWPHLGQERRFLSS